MKFKVGDKVCYKHKKGYDNVEVGEIGTICGTSETTGKYGVAFETKDVYKHSCDGLCRDNYGWWCDEDTLEPVDNIVHMADGTIIGEFGTGDALPTNEWFKLVFKNGSSIEVMPNEDAIRSKEPELVWIDKISLPTATETKEMVERVAKELNGMLGVSFTKKEEKKMPTKFTFYVTEGTRVDKSCNGTIPTMTTTVTNGLDEVSVTCDKVDFNERQGVLEGIAQLYCKGRFDKEYEAAVKLNKRADKVNRTCIYCGKIFDTVEERVEHEKWHVECKRARRERYLLRKRAKEIAFEEQAQKLAKEIIAEDNKK